MRRLGNLGLNRRNKERGAVAVIVAVFTSTVVLGMLAFSVDMGNIEFERRQLQNGTDAAAMALAQTCATDASACDPSKTPTMLNSLASANAVDKMSQLDTSRGTNGQCVRNSTPPQSFPGMPTCASASSDASISDLSQCVPLPSEFKSGDGAKLPYVETYVQTKSAAVDNTLLPSIFAKAAAGVDGVRQTACARAVWGPGAPSSKNVVSLTMSECDWAAQTGFPSAPNYPAAPSGAWPGYSDADARPDWPSVEHAVWSKGNPVADCDTSSPGGTAPGGFAWLAGQGCQATVTEGWIKTDPGADQECTQAQLLNMRGKLVYIPVFDCRAKAATNPIPTTPADFCTDSNGANTYYHISGFAPFYLSGWFFGANAASNMDSIKPPAGRYLCGGSERCLFGWFTQGLIAEGDFEWASPSDPNYGITIVKPAG
jgi:hypothetical protein